MFARQGGEPLPLNSLTQRATVSPVFRPAATRSFGIRLSRGYANNPFAWATWPAGHGLTD